MNELWKLNLMTFSIPVYVKSNTLIGDKDHPTGVVLAEIIKANIPVRNGVVHLIQRPLMVVDTTITEFLQVSGHRLKLNTLYITDKFWLQLLYLIAKDAMRGKDLDHLCRPTSITKIVEPTNSIILWIIVNPYKFLQCSLIFHYYRSS